MTRILILEDDPALCRGIAMALTGPEQTAVQAESVARAWELLNRESFSLLILDINLPDGSGLDLLRGLEAGADDYITKPFSLAVLRARVNAQLRRAASMDPARVELDGFTFDFGRLEFTRDGTTVELSRTEQRLLRLLVENRGRILPRQLLVDRVWNGGEFVDENALSVAVRRLRAKLPGAPIRTVYGTGYSWEVEK